MLQLSKLIALLMIAYGCSNTTNFTEENHSSKEAAIVQLGAIININPQQLQILLCDDPNLFLIDIREPEELIGEWKTLEQAINIQMNEIMSGNYDLPNDKTIVLVCRSGRRTKKTAEYLAGQGITVYDLQGGMKGYYHYLKNIEAKLLHDPEEETELVSSQEGC